MNDPIPSQACAFDNLARHIEEDNDRRLREHHQMRRCHKDRGDAHCSEDGQLLPCRSLQIINGTESVVRA